jgi:hypothetical protein
MLSEAPDGRLSDEATSSIAAATRTLQQGRFVALALRSVAVFLALSVIALLVQAALRESFSTLTLLICAAGAASGFFTLQAGNSLDRDVAALDQALATEVSAQTNLPPSNVIVRDLDLVRPVGGS